MKITRNGKGGNGRNQDKGKEKGWEREGKTNRFRIRNFWEGFIKKNEKEER